MGGYYSGHFEVLRDPDPQSSECLDIVAVHDIESQWHSWKVTSTGLLWLPDLLLAKAPSARIMVYGYNPQVFVHNVVDEAASSLMYELVKNRQQDEERPIIFVCHSLGGIIAQKALLLAQMDARFAKLRWATIGAVFIRTPHNGHAVSSNATDCPITCLPGDQHALYLQAPETLARISYRFRLVEASLKVVRICVDDCEAQYDDVEDDELLMLGRTTRSTLQVEERFLDTSDAWSPATRLESVHRTISHSISTNDQEMVLRDAIGRVLEGFSEKLQRDLDSSALAFPREAFSWHPGTCRWLFKTPEFIRWRKHDDSTVLWLHGLPGAGKTTLASFALEHIRATLAPNEALGVYFWQRGTTIDVAKSILKSITRQLLKLDSDGSDKASLHRVMATIDTNSPPMSTWTFRRHLKTLLHSVPTTANLFLIFDGLDEYVNIADHILSEVGLLRSNANRSGHIKCIMTGRNKCSTRVSAIDALEIDLDGNRFVEQDMSLVVRDKCIELSRQFPSRQKALESLESRILENIQGVFLRILLMLHDLSRRLRSEDFDVSRIIECLPLQIESIYQQRLQLIEESDRVLSSRVFILLTCAVRPLRFDELSEALSLVLPGYSRPESVLSESFLLHRCGGLVVIYKDHTVDFLHHSIREHLIAKRNKALLGDDFLRDCQTHTLLAQACLQCLLQREQAREATPVADHAPSSRGSATPGQAFESYAARFWSLHYRLAESQDSYLAGLLQDVLDTSIGTRLNRISECSMPNLVNPLSSTPRNTIFRECVKIGSTTLAQIYLEMGIDVNTKLCPSGASALHCAAASGQANVVKLLLKKGASINAKTILHGRTALHFACDRGDANVVETLLRHSADLNVKTINNTETPLHVAAAKGHLEVMKLLLQSGANVNATTSITAETPLHIAAAYGFVDEASYLLEGRWQSWSGAETPSSPGTPPSDLAPDHKPSSSNMWSFDSTLSYDAPSMDIDILYTSKSYQPVDIGAKNCDGWTPLHVAAASGNLDIVRLLLHHGAEINTKTFDGRTAPYLAADYGHQFVSSVLVALNFNQSSKSQLACRSNRLVIWRGHCEFEGLHREENDDSDAEMELNFEQSHQSESGILDGQDDWTIIMSNLMDAPDVVDLNGF